VLLVMACASGPRTIPPRAYPPRPPNCDLIISSAAKPEVSAWKDLGVAEVVCHISVSMPECLQRFHAAVCQMGGDLVYDVPRRPLRPADQALLFRGRVAHRLSP
jgi:hypothetical protein